MACVGNVCVIILRILENKSTDAQIKNGIFISSLASSDLFMGMYMLILASVDAYHGEEYYKFSDEWRVSIGCRVAGFLSLLSGETSLLLLTLITIDRYLVLVFPFSEKHFHKRSAFAAVLGAWVIGLSISLSASILAGPDSDFYELSDVCIGLPLITRPDKYVVEPIDVGNTEVVGRTFHVPNAKHTGSAWTFSIIIFLGLNFASCLVIMILYIIVFIVVTRASRRVHGANYKKEIKMAFRMFAVVIANILCWSPVIILGILSQTASITLGLDMYVWIVVFVLPINASLNPYLYTLAFLKSS